jgi:tRNA-dihydrouridine synthase A
MALLLNYRAMHEPSPYAIAHKASVAPMMDWTDRHCRFFHRLLSKNALLYTEMVTTGALLHGDVPRHLRFNAQEHPLALQLGGSEPADLAKCAKLAQDWGYDEVNLNCGCPSERVQRGAFGACLMAEPALVADCVKAMVDAVDLPITVKHRIGIDKTDSYAFVRDFVGAIADAGCRTLVVHARSAWLKGLSPKENREIPPLRPDMVYQLKRDFPDLTFVINGGIQTDDQAKGHLAHCDGVMVGRSAYHNPWWLASWDATFWPDQKAVAAPPKTRFEVEQHMVAYMQEAAQSEGLGWAGIARHMLGLYASQPGGRLWRQVWSDHRLKEMDPREVSDRAQRALGSAVPRARDSTLAIQAD